MSSFIRINPSYFERFGIKLNGIATGMSYLIFWTTQVSKCITHNYKPLIPFSFVHTSCPQFRGERERLFGSREQEIENHIPVLREGNGNSQIATGREGKFEACNPGNHIKSKTKFKIFFMP